MVVKRFDVYLVKLIRKTKPNFYLCSMRWHPVATAPGSVPLPIAAPLHPSRIWVYTWAIQ